MQVISDTVGNLKIDRSTKRREKVDALVALVMALEGYTSKPAQPQSVYEREDFNVSMVLF